MISLRLQVPSAIPGVAVFAGVGRGGVRTGILVGARRRAILDAIETVDPRTGRPSYSDYVEQLVSAPFEAWEGGRAIRRLGCWVSRGAYLVEVL